MADQPDIKYRIVTEADTSGLKGAASGMEDVKEGTEKAAGATEQFNIHGRAQFLLFSEINRIAPGLGTALHAAFAGPLGPIILAGVAIAEVVKYLKEENAELDKQAEAAADPTFLNAITARLDVFRNAASATQSYQDALDQIGVKEHTITAEMENQLKVQKALELSRAALVSAQKELDLAKIQQAEAEGKMTPEQAAEARAAVEKKYIEQVQKDKEAAEDKELSRKTTAFLQLDAQQTDLEKKAAQARDKVTADEAHRAALKVDPKKQAEDEKAEQKKIDDAQKRIDKAKANNTDIFGNQIMQDTDPNKPNYVPGDARLVEQRAAEDVMAKAQARLHGLQEQDKQYAATQTPESAAALQKEKDKAKEAEDAAKTNKESLDKLSTEIDTLTQTIKETRPVEHQTTTTKEATIDTQEDTRIAGDISKDVQLIEHGKYGKNTTEIQQAFAGVTAAYQNHHDVVVAELRKHGTTIQALTQRMAQIQTQVSHNN